MKKATVVSPKPHRALKSLTSVHCQNVSILLTSQVDLYSPPRKESHANGGYNFDSNASTPRITTPRIMTPRIVREGDFGAIHEQLNDMHDRPWQDVNRVLNRLFLYLSLAMYLVAALALFLLGGN